MFLEDAEKEDAQKEERKAQKRTCGDAECLAQRARGSEQDAQE
jgi:hypothetical protein